MKQKTPSIIYFILNGKNIKIVLISSKKHFFIYYYDQFENPPYHFAWSIVATIPTNILSYLEQNGVTQ